MVARAGCLKSLLLRSAVNVVSAPEAHAHWGTRHNSKSDSNLPFEASVPRQNGFRLKKIKDGLASIVYAVVQSSQRH